MFNPGAGNQVTDPRYLRQVTMPGFGVAGQRALARARVLVVGAGGLGSPAAIYLAAAGVGVLGVVDDDVVELSNLHRQPLHMTGAVGRAKVDSATELLHALNPHVQVVPLRERLTEETAFDLVAGFDVVVDGADNFDTRYVVSDACAAAGVPHVWAAVMTTGGQLSVFAPGGPTFRDLYPEPPSDVPSCAAAGVLGVVPGVLGVTQAAETIKLLTGLGEPLVGRVGVYDMLTGEWEYVPLAGRGSGGTVASLGQLARGGVPAGVGGTSAEVAADELATLLNGALEGGQPAGARKQPVLLLDVREVHEFEAGHVPGARSLPLSVIMDDPQTAVQQVVSRAAGTDAEVFVMCQAGVRSAYAIEVFESVLSLDSRSGLNRDSGPRFVNVAGGMNAWLAAGLPCFRTSSPPR